MPAVACQQGEACDILVSICAGIVIVVSYTTTKVGEKRRRDKGQAGMRAAALLLVREL